MNDFNKPLDGKKQLQEMMNNTPNATKRPSGLRACADGLDVNPDKDFAQKCIRNAADRMEQLELKLAAAREELKTAIGQRDAIEESRVMTSAVYVKTAKQRDKLLEEREQWRLSSVCRELTEQRDRLVEQIEANHKGTLMLEQMVYDAREQRDRLAEALENCREDSIELLGERDWWQLENRCDYQQRYQDTRDNVTRADALLESLNHNKQ
jgi:hypothetical protein